MNFITWKRAYSLYPDATFRHHFSVALDLDYFTWISTRRFSAHRYKDIFSSTAGIIPTAADFTVHYLSRPGDMNSNSPLYRCKSLQSGPRRLRDSYTWSVPLRTAHLDPSDDLHISPFDLDANTWQMHLQP